MLSIIIASYLKSGLLKFGLASLFEQNITCEHEIIVLNDGIEDETEDVCRSFGDKVRCIFTGQRNVPTMRWRCPGYAINIGVKISSGEQLLLAQPEIYYATRDCINGLVKCSSADKKVLAVPKGFDDFQGAFLSHLKGNGSWEDYDGKTLKELNTELPFCMVMNKDEFSSIGGFDEDFVGYCWDDNDFLNRLLKNDCRIEKLDHTIVHLFHTRSERVGLKSKKEPFEYNKKVFEDKRDIIIRNVGKNWGVLDK